MRGTGAFGGDPFLAALAAQVPSEETIYSTLHSVYKCAGFSSQCLIAALVYVERIISISGEALLGLY